MTYEQWQIAVRPKVTGTLNVCNHLPNLSYLVMLSSGTAITGNVSQANYAAGNTFQDALARHRTANGQPAVAINLGPVDDVGYVAERGDDVLKRVDKAVTSITLSVDHITRLVESAIVSPSRKIIDQSQIITCFPRYEALPEDRGVRNDKRFGTLRLGDEGARPSQNANGTSPVSRVNELTRELASTGSSIVGPKAVELVTALLVAEIGELFRVDHADIDVSMPLTHYGVDSLVAVRFRNWLSSEVRARLTIFEILQSHSVVEFAALVAGRSGLISNVD
jgi:KR domain/Phosphopantetheine attachment site